MARDRGLREGDQPKGTISPIGRTAVAKVDITDGPSVELTKDGFRAVRVAEVSNLKGNGAARLFWAINAAGVPKYGDFHPVIANLPVGRVHAALASAGTTEIAIVTCEYFFPTGGNMHFANIEGVRESSLPQLEIVSTVQSATTEFYLDDAGGPHQMIIPYIRTDGEVSEPLPDQSGSVEYQLPMTVFRYMRREATPVDVIRQKARDFVGTINNPAIFGEAGINFWMCTRLDGVSDDAGQTSNVTYEFQRHPDTWNPVVVYVDPVTGLRVPDADTGALGSGVNVTANGIGRFRIYLQKNFDDLELTI